MSSVLPDLPKTMRAILQPEKKSHELVMSTTQPVPTPAHPEDVLVKVHATSPCLGELDWALWAPDIIGDDKVPIPGQDIAGTVVHPPSSGSGGDSGRQFRAGDAVYCRIPGNRPGGAAEYALARASELALKPPTLSWADAAATPLSALTAYQALFVHGTLRAAALPTAAAASGAEEEDEELVRERERARALNAGQTVLITAAAGSVGGWAVQLARLAGAGAVIAVCGPASAARARELGATETADYTAPGGLAAWVAADPEGREADLVVDCAGGDTLAACWYAVSPDGALISICGPPHGVRPSDLFGEGKRDKVRALLFIVESRGDNLEVISRLLELGKCRPVIDSVMRLEDFKEAWDKVEGRHAKGKVVLMVDEGV